MLTVPRAGYQGLRPWTPPCRGLSPAGGYPLRGASPLRGAPPCGALGPRSSSPVCDGELPASPRPPARPALLDDRELPDAPRDRRCSTIACRPPHLAPNCRGRWLAGAAERIHSAVCSCAPSSTSPRAGVAAPLSRLARNRSRSASAPRRRLVLHSAQELAVGATAGGQRKSWMSNRQAARRAGLQVAPGGRVPVGASWDARSPP